MSKPNKHVPESDTISDKLRVSLNTENNKPDTVNSDHGSPITPLQTRPSGLTSTTTTTTTSSCSSSSSESVTKKPHIGRSNLSAAQSKPNVPSAAQSPKSSTPSAAQSASANLAGVQQKSTSTSATQSSKSTAQSKSSIPSGGKPSNSMTPSAAKSGSSSQKTASGNPRSSRGSATSHSVSSKNSTQPQQVKMVPTGTLFPSGKVKITGMAQGTPTSKVLDPTAKFYGYGSIMKGGRVSTTTSGSSSRSLVISSGLNGGSDADTQWKKVMSSTNPEEVKILGNRMFREGCFTEALKLYDRALQLSPTNAIYHSNRAAALSGLGRIGEAVIECEEAIKLDPNFARAHHSLATLLLRLGQVDNAGKHFFFVEAPSDPMVVKLLEKLDKHLTKCADARKRCDWNLVLTEASAAMASGADWSPQLAMCKVEALLKLLRLDDAQKVVAFVPKVEPIPAPFSETRFFDMIPQAYTCFVKSQMELALGRFENAVTAAEKASEIDPRNNEVEKWYRNVTLIVKARDRGNDFYESERYSEASAAYGEGLKFDPFNTTLLYQRADCFFKFGMWESSIEDCNRALHIQPSYIKALIQRAESYCKLERWAEAVRDYQTLRKELPYDKVIAESLFHAQVALKKSRGEVVLNMEFKGEVEEISDLEEFRAVLTRPGVSIVHYFRASDQQCTEMSVFMDALCIRYPSLHFLKVNIEKYPEVANVEKVRVVPTFKIYKLGIGIKDIVCPSKEALENSFRHYGL